MSRTTYCSLCSTTLQCQCGTHDHLHEGSCDLLGILCSDCWEMEIDRIPDGPEPDMYAGYVKDLTLAEIDALMVEHAQTVPWSAQRPLREAVSV